MEADGWVGGFPAVGRWMSTWSLTDRWVDFLLWVGMSIWSLTDGWVDFLLWVDEHVEVDGWVGGFPTVGGWHTPTTAFRHLPPNSARFSYATEGALFISAQLSTDAVSALRKVWVLTIMTVEAS